MGTSTEPELTHTASFSVSVLMAWRSADPARIRLWEYCKPLWESLSEVELCVADDGNTDGPFARAAAWNRAAAMASGDIFVVWGADILPDLPAVLDAARVAALHGWARVFSAILSFSDRQTDDILAGNNPDYLGARPRPYEVPGVLAVRRDVWDSVGGMDERFGAGYGYEDCALRNLLAHRYGAHQARGRHAARILYHPHVEQPAPTNHTLFWSEYAKLAPGLN